MSMQTNSGATRPMLSYTDKLAAQWTDFLLLAGRVLMGWIFVSSGWSKLMDIPGFVSDIPAPRPADWLGYIAPPVEFIGGLASFSALRRDTPCLIMLLLHGHRSFIVAHLLDVPAGAARQPE